MKHDATSKVKKIYQDLFAEHGRSEKALCWSKNKQFIRFGALTQAFPTARTNPFTVLDFGCGLGDLYAYLKARFKEQMQYTGVDLVPEFIESNRKTYPYVQFDVLRNVKEMTTDFDFIVLSGVFNIQYGESDQEQWEILTKHLTFLFQRTRVALSVDFLSSEVDFIRKGAFHADRNELLKWVRASLSPRVIVDLSYMPFEFALTIFKNSEIQKPQNIYAK